METANIVGLLSRCFVWECVWCSEPIPSGGGYAVSEDDRVFCPGCAEDACRGQGFYVCVREDIADTQKFADPAEEHY